MSLELVKQVIQPAQLREKDRKWFPQWLARCAACLKPVKSLAPHGFQVAANCRPTGMKPVEAKHREK